MGDEWTRPIAAGLNRSQDALLERAYADMHFSQLGGCRPSPKRDAAALVKKGMAKIESLTFHPDRFGAVTVDILKLTPKGIEAHEATYADHPELVGP